jgi:hypothetical protein
MDKNIRQPENVDSTFLKRIENIYGDIDMENDFFSGDLKIYYKTSSIGKNGGVNHKIIKLANFGEPLKKLSQAVKALKILMSSQESRQDEDLAKIADDLKNTFNSYRSFLRKSYPDQYDTIKKQLDEISTTGGGAGAASFTPGTGAQYASPYAFGKNKKYRYKDGGIYTQRFGYKLVPKKIKGSGLEINNLFEVESPNEFQQKRIKAFDIIEDELNSIYTSLSNFKNETIQFYNTNPGSYDVIKPTDLILDYIKDIKELLTNEEN